MLVPTEELLRPQLIADNHLPWMLSAALVALFFVGGIAGLVVAWVQAARLAKLAERDRAGLGGPLVGGPHGAVRGRVELASAGDVVVGLTIDEQAQNRGGTTQGHAWLEVGRRIEARPFYLVTDEGERVRVDPSGTLLVIADRVDLGSTVPMRRQRAARLVRDQVVVARGALGRAYDGVHAEWRLTPSREGPMVLADARRLAERHEPRASFLRNASLAATSAFLFTNMLLGFPFVAASLRGTSEDATVLQVERHVSRTKGSVSSWGTVNVVGESGYKAAFRVPAERCSTLEPAQGRRAKVRIVHVGGFASLGSVPTLNGFALLGAFALSLVAAGLTWSGYSARIPWYEAGAPEVRGSGFVMP
ncbi:MAG: hypothetical protein IPF92_05560 [Myxococcales bacterium]|nr:hypothetical protein [Myxococcales bacterium]MBL0198036.1 hypothetical protein [Myxococcales bacterium]HQY61265.1 hypothetical protein [Polyangiaceae bacterium]